MRTVGLDIGGAHLKIAVAERGRIHAVHQIACPLWLGLDRLSEAFAATADLLSADDLYAVTMTGELTEIFNSRAEGVLQIIDRAAAHLPSAARFYAGRRGLLTAEAARQAPLSVASANYMATAEFISKRRPHALLIDLGSTTTDIVACDRIEGETDQQRLRTGELVYTGFTRTMVPAVTVEAPLSGVMQGLARDAFATMSDVRRILGELDEESDQHAPADGRGKSVAESIVRLARGFGCDSDHADVTAWRAAAAYIRDRQVASIVEAARQVALRAGDGAVLGVVAAGIGHSTAAVVAEQLKLPSQPFSDLIDVAPQYRDLATYCAPAVALALLAGAA